MGKQSGLGDQLLVGGWDLGDDIGSVGNISGPLATLNTTGITKSAFERIGGQRDGAIEYTAFFNPGQGRAHERLSKLPTGDQLVTYLRGTGLGKAAACLVGKQIGYDGSRGDDGSFTFGVTTQGSHYGLEWGVQLTDGVRTDAAPTAGATFDGGAGGDAYVSLSGDAGDYVSTPDAAVLDVTGDIDLRAHVALDDWTPPAQNVLVGKWDSGSGNRCYQLAVTTGGNLTIGWSTDGTASMSATSSVATGFADGTAHWCRVTMKVDNGAGSAEVTFYTSEDGAAWTQLGTVQLPGATTSIFSGTSPLELGSQNNGVSNRVTGRIYSAQVYSGIDGTLVADPVATGPGVTDSTGLVWTLHGNAVVLAPSRHGLQAYLHVLDMAGADATVTLEESVDGTTWTAVTGGAFAQVTAGRTWQRLATARDQTVARYLRVSTAGTFTSLSLLVVVVVNPVEVTF